MPYSIEDIRGAVARGWCDDKNRTKEMDSDLAEAITKEIWAMLHEVPPIRGSVMAHFES